MKIVRLLAAGALPLLAAAATLSGCLSAPTYPIEPGIDFKDLTVVRAYAADRRQPPTDTFKIVVAFKDGDGDLGLRQEELNKPPYTGANQYNYFLQLYRRDPQTKQFVPLREREDFGNFPPLYTGDYKPAPLKGDLKYRLALTYGAPLLAGDEVQFRLTIKDRALNQSNIVTTSNYIVPVR